MESRCKVQPLPLPLPRLRSSPHRGRYQHGSLCREVAQSVATLAELVGNLPSGITRKPSTGGTTPQNVTQTHPRRCRGNSPRGGASPGALLGKATTGVPGQACCGSRAPGRCTLEEPIWEKLPCKGLTRGARWNWEEKNPVLPEYPSSALY